MKILYAKLTNDCNLSCRHCNILGNEHYNESIFFKQIQNFDGRIIAFGGEPSLYRDRLIKLLRTEKISSIVTNLLILDKELLYYYKRIKVATSWNPARFTPEQYQLWLENIKLLESYNIECSILITLTEDLIKMDINQFMEIIKCWSKIYYSISEIRFEQLIDASKSQYFYDKVDNWLCRLYKLWNIYDIHIINKITDEIFHWDRNCNQIYTLEPNGVIYRQCPHKMPCIIREECLSCKYNHICRPCILQSQCSFPKKLYELVNKNRR